VTLRAKRAVILEERSDEGSRHRRATDAVGSKAAGDGIPDNFQRASAARPLGMTGKHISNR
jgi:hypothetical protein